MNLFILYSFFIIMVLSVSKADKIREITLLTSKVIYYIILLFRGVAQFG
jgi:hypothetical protein